MAEVTAVVDGLHWTADDRVWAYDIHTLAERWVDVEDIDESTWVGNIDPEGANLQVLKLSGDHYILVQSIDLEVQMDDR
jgi:hypothetical protein